jgi:hypothetical protein
MTGYISGRPDIYRAWQLYIVTWQTFVMCVIYRAWQIYIVKDMADICHVCQIYIGAKKKK